MFISNSFDAGFRKATSALAAAAVLLLAGSALEFGHTEALPRGTVEVGALQPLSVEPMAMVMLPAIEVTASRLPPAGSEDRVVLAKASQTSPGRG